MSDPSPSDSIFAIRHFADDDTLPGVTASVVELTLTYDQRRRSRQRVRLDDGTEAALQLPRGTVLNDGQRLRREDGAVVLVRAAPETLSSVSTANPTALARAAYHLGNRHVALEVTEGRLRYQHDHVLDDMVRKLGLTVTSVEAPFHPEAGAYSGGHAHGASTHTHGAAEDAPEATVEALTEHTAHHPAHEPPVRPQDHRSHHHGHLTEDNET